MTFIAGGKVIVNGKDITELVRQVNETEESAATSEEPIRYIKK